MLKLRWIVYTASLLGCLWLGVGTSAYAQSAAEKNRLSNEIEDLNSDINRKQRLSDNINSEVTALEKKLGELSRRQHETEQKIEETRERLATENIRRQKLQAELRVQRSGLAQQLQAMYSAGEQSHLRMLLRQDNPSDISRTLRYFDYLNKSRSKKIDGINKTIDEIRVVTESMEKDRVYLSGLEETLAVQSRQTQSTLQARETALNNINSDIRDKQSQLQRLKAQEAALQEKIERIARERAAEREREKQAAEQRREAARRQAQQQAQAQKPSSQQTRPSVNVQAATARTPAPSKAPRPTQSASQFRADRAFSSLKGALPQPVKGKVIHNYNSRRNEKQRWRGVVIAAPGGAGVQAVANGRVVFSGWMDGYGHLIILEHDANYMSLYGYNRAVYKRKGQRVKAGEVIAAVGNSSGRRQNALYFEIRRKTAPQNPAQWFR